MKSIFSLFILIASINAFASLTEDFEKIKNHGRDLEPAGAICEEIAQLMFAEKYPEPQYHVVTGIEYSDLKNRSIGELDIVVFNNQTNNVDIIGEVKCWKSPKNGLDKAKDQRQRFLTSVKSGQPLIFKWLDNPSVKLEKSQFTKVTNFYSIAQSGTIVDGYDFELPYTLKELMQLRKDILFCHSYGDCKKVDGRQY